MFGPNPKKMEELAGRVVQAALSGEDLPNCTLYKLARDAGLMATEEDEDDRGGLVYRRVPTILGEETLAAWEEK